MTDLKFDSRNYRIHTDQNKRIIRKSLEECGAGRSVLVDKDDVLIAGNGVYEQAQELGLKVRIVESDGEELIVVKRTDLSSKDEKRKLLALADNHSSDTSVFDYDTILEDFSADDLDLWEFKIDGDFLKSETDFIPDNLTAPHKDAHPTIKLTFENFKQMELFEKELKPIAEKYHVTYAVSCGEI